MNTLVPQGFRLAGVSCGIKEDPTREDLTLIVMDAPSVAAGVYTQNLVFAAPVAVDRERTPSDRMRVVVVNSGNANACTGHRGMEDAVQMTRLAADACNAEPDQALVMSTGVIGEFLPMDRIATGIQAAAARLGDDEEAFLSAARGIITTDKSHKIAGRSIEVAGQRVQISGIAKGAGMIGPRMATMLAAVMTDAALTPADAQAALVAAVDDSFNCISVEGHMSTNDTVLLLASGAACGEPLAGDALSAFRAALREVCIELARQIPDDGEGASHLITIDVCGAASRDDAFSIAKTVANSNLVKTGIAGNDPNWGRIVCGAGYSGVNFDPHRLSLKLNGTLLYRDGAPVEFDAASVSRSMQESREVHILLELKEGDASARFWTSDLTVDYVRFNADYHT
jgi:glutamate N-acetyltransferase/amino-acid N-acetyltransferase